MGIVLEPGDGGSQEDDIQQPPSICSFLLLVEDS